jgi:glycine/D-amino acid oxidase-like deaminating enzyme
MEPIELPQALAAKLADQIIQDPGIPVPYPTVSAWQEPAHPLATSQSQKLPGYTDFAIIGSGITGCSAAKTVLEHDQGHNKRVTMFEARNLTTGATSRNGGFLQSHVPLVYGRFVDALGADTAKQMAKFCDLTLEEIVKTAETEGLLETSEIRDVTSVSVFEKEEAFEEARKSVRMYEDAVHKGQKHFEVVDAETARKVS